jgi:WD40 repeat protein
LIPSVVATFTMNSSLPVNCFPFRNVYSFLPLCWVVVLVSAPVFGYSFTYTTCSNKVSLCLDPGVLTGNMEGHTDAVWGLSIHSQRLQLLSCSSDGTVKLWSPTSKVPLLSTYVSDQGKSLCK